jgi:hypothetical protein
MAKQQTQPVRRIDRIARRVGRIPRFSRILLATAISLVIVGLVALPMAFIIADQAAEGGVLYGPTIVIALVFLVAYGLGWWALVGFDADPNQPWQADRPAGWMVVVGIVALVVLLLEVIFGLLFGFAL